MDLLDDDAWFEAATRREESVTGEALADYGWGTHMGAVVANPKGYGHFALLRSMVFQAWRQLVAEWNLGAGTAVAEAKGQELIMARLHQPESEVQEALMALLAMRLSMPQEQWLMIEAVHSQIRSVLRKVLTPQDWQTIKSSAVKG